MWIKTPRKHIVYYQSQKRFKTHSAINDVTDQTSPMWKWAGPEPGPSSASSSSVLFQYTRLPPQVLTVLTFPRPKHNSQSGCLIKPCCKSSGHVWKWTFPKVTAFLNIGDLFTQIYLIYFSATELQISIDSSEVETCRRPGKDDYLGEEASYPTVISAFHSLLLLLLESDF